MSELKSKSTRQRYSRKKCARGSISRRGYTYFSKRAQRFVKVKPACTKSKRSLRARGKSPERVIPPLRSGTLRKYGFRVSASKEERHKSLRKAVKAYGATEVVRKLNAVRVLTRNTRPEQSKIYTESIDFVHSL